MNRLYKTTFVLRFFLLLLLAESQVLLVIGSNSGGGQGGLLLIGFSCGHRNRDARRPTTSKGRFVFFGKPPDMTGRLRDSDAEGKLCDEVH